MNYREAVLEGSLAAARLHEQLGIRAHVEQARSGHIDVFGAFIPVGAVLIFRPLNGLLGACIPGPNPGAIVTTQRPLSIQRFTAAHELGHIFMQHKVSFDGEEILGAIETAESDSAEIQANAFAAEFMLPRWLLASHASRQGWNRENMSDPAVVYQLSLRVGASYEATCRSLKNHSIISPGAAEALLRVQPRTIKQNVIPDLTPDDWFRDVWILTEKDKQTLIVGHPNDIFVFRLTENTGAGYLWDVASLRDHGFLIDQDVTELGVSDDIGASTTRVISAHADSPTVGEIALRLSRPWLPDDPPADRIGIRYDLIGKERGLPRSDRVPAEAA
jgi:hypothetical protein